MSAAPIDGHRMDFAGHAPDFERDGFVMLRGALSDADLDLIEAAFDARLRDAATAAPLYEGDATILQSHGSSIDDPQIARLIDQTPVADIARGLFRGRGVWYWSEQAWLKQGGAARRTPWHQDLSYVPFAGDGFAVLWITLDDLPAENVLEVIRGSHRRTLYNGTLFRPDSETDPLYDEADARRLPEIEQERERWDIVSHDMKRGDVLAFHPACLHGGAPVSPGQRRRAMSFRFFSDDIVYRPLPMVKGADYGKTQEDRRDKLTPGIDRLSPGDPIHGSGIYRQVR